MHSSTKTLTPRQVRNLKIGVRSGLAAGIVVSIAANALHAVTAALAAHDSQGWLVISIVLAALAPLFAFVCVEFVVRIPIHRAVIAVARLAITLGLCGLACWISFWNIASVVVRLHEPSVRYLWPWIIDGMMLVATLSLVALEQYETYVETVTTKAAQSAADAEVAAIADAAEAIVLAARAKELRKAKKASRTYQNADAAGRRAWTAKWNKDYDAEQARIARTAPVSPGPAGLTPVATVTEAELAAAVR